MSIELAVDQVVEDTIEETNRKAKIAVSMIDQFLSIYAKDRSLMTHKAIKQLGQRIIYEQNKQ